jgi:HK97 family phage major capsid protein
MYNKSSLGAKLEEHFKPEDRFSSIGEYCAAIFDKKTMSSRVGADKRVETLMKIFEFQNSFGSEEPGAGGFLIPEIMRSELLQLAIEESIVRSRATVIPMTTLRVPIPTVDDTSHATTIFGGIQFYWGEEGVALTESTATFGRIMLEARKFTGYFAVPQELLDDAPAFSGWFDAKVPQGLAFFEDVAFLTGSAADQPLGFINCDASVSVSAQTGQDAGTIVWENVTDMYARMLPQSLKNAVWICAIDTFPQLARMALSVGTGGGPVWIGGWSQPGSDMPPMTILGRPVIFTEKVPKLGTTGDINFVDLSYYLIGDRQQIRVDSSDQYLFKNNQVAYRIIERVDGRPWLRSALTPHNGSSNTLSPFVQLASR